MPGLTALANGVSAVGLTLPSFAVVGLLIVPLGFGVVPAVVVVTFFATLPVLRNAVVGLSQVDPALVESARGIGMSSFRTLVQVQLPLAWPVILTGVRVSAQMVMGIAAVAACPNVHLKLGGIGMPRLGFDWSARTKPIGSEELATSMAPLMTYCIEQFGPDRCMFESNFPPDKVSFSHHVLFNAFKRFSKDYTAAERAALFHDTAVRAYRIGSV